MTTCRATAALREPSRSIDRARGLAIALDGGAAAGYERGVVPFRLTKLSSKAG